MSWVFVSHSSRDSRQAVAVKAWLIEQESSAPTPGRRRGADSKRGAAKRKQKGVQAPGGMVDMQALGGPFGAAAQWKPNSPEEVITQVAKYMKSLPELIISGQLGLDPLPPVERRELLSGYSLFDALETIPRLQSRWDVAFTTTQRPDIVEADFLADDDFESCRRARERVMQHRDLLVSPRATAQLQREIIESASTDESAAKIERNTLPGLPARRSSPAARVIDVSGAAPTWCGWSGGLDWVEAHGESERVGLANDAAHGALRVEPGEVVAAEIGVLDVVGEHVPHRDQNRVFHGDKGFLLPRATGETAVSSAEVGGVFGAGRSQGSGAQRAGQPPVAVTGLAGATFAGRFVMPRAHPGQEARCAAVRKRLMSAPVSATMTSANGLAHPRDRRQVLKLAGKREHLLLNARRQFPDRCGELVDALQMQPAQERVVLTEVAGYV